MMPKVQEEGGWTSAPIRVRNAGIRIRCAACKQTVHTGRIEPRPFLAWGWVAAIALACVLAFGAGRASAEPGLVVEKLLENNGTWLSPESLDALAYQIASQGLALKMAQAERCVRKHPFGALTSHDGCLYEVSDFNGWAPQFRLCRDAKGEPVCGVKR